MIRTRTGGIWTETDLDKGYADDGCLGGVQTDGVVHSRHEGISDESRSEGHQQVEEEEQGAHCAAGEGGGSYGGEGGAP